MADDVLTAEQFATWLMPHEVLARIPSVLDTDSAKEAIISRLRGDAIRSAAARWSVEESGGTWMRQPFIIIPAWHWNTFRHSADGKFWVTGDLHLSPRAAGVSYVVGAATRPRPINYFDIHIDPAGVEAFVIRLPGYQPKPPNISPDKIAPPPLAIPLPTIQPPSATVTPTAHKGGRPPKDWWDDFWIEMCRQFYVGDLKPDGKQVIVEKAMLDWAESHDHELSEASARKAARRLLAALRDEGKN